MGHLQDTRVAKQDAHLYVDKKVKETEKTKTKK